MELYIEYIHASTSSSTYVYINIIQVAVLAPLALLLVSEARYAYLVIAHLMIILWRSTCTHTAHMYDGKNNTIHL